MDEDNTPPQKWREPVDTKKRVICQEDHGHKKVILSIIFSSFRVLFFWFIFYEQFVI